MATNYIQEGNVIQFVNAGSAISAGDVVVVGDNGDAVLGVALVDIAATTGVGSVQLEGVFDLPKVDAAVIVQGEYVIWDASVGKFDDNAATPAAGDVSDGAVAWEGLGATTDANIQVKLTGRPGTLA